MAESIISMSLPFELSPVHLLAGIALLVVVCSTISKQWKRRTDYSFLPGPPLSSMLGYLLDVHDPLALDYHFKMTEKYGHVTRLRGGAFGSDALYIADPLALHSVLVKDQSNFPESNEFSGLFGIIHHGNNLASVAGQEHKRQRKLMNPVLTASNVSKLTPLFYKIAHELRDRLTAEVSRLRPNQTIDVLDRLTRTALELISQGGIGHTFNSFEQNSKEFHEFHEALKTVLPTAGRLFIVLPYFETWRKLEPVWLRRFLSKMIYFVPWPAARQFKAAVDTMHPVCRMAFEKKKEAFEEDGIEGLKNTMSGGRDLTALLMQVNSEADEEDRMPDETIIANMSSIVLGGQETTSGSLSRLLCVMAADPSLQTRLREEVTQAKARKTNGEELDYNELNALPLLDAVCRESLRLFAPVTFVWRQTSRDTVVPLQFPVRDTRSGVEIREVQITKGTQVYIGMGAANQSTAVWGPDAHEFRPDRWLKSGPENSTQGVKMPGIYSNSMTFLGGGRSCPGMKFALLEIKLVLATLIPAFSFAPGPDKIEWRMGITLSPHIEGRDKEGPKVPMKVTAL